MMFEQEYMNMPNKPVYATVFSSKVIHLPFQLLLDKELVHWKMRLE